MRKIQLWIRVVWVGLMLSWSHVAVAEDGTLLVPAFQGSRPQALRDLTVEVLIGDGFDVVELEVTPTLTTKSSNTSVSSAAGRHHARAIVLGSTQLSKREWETTFTVRDGESGKTLGKFEIAAATFPGLQKAYRGELVDKLLTLIDDTSEGKAAAAAAPPAPSQPETKLPSKAESAAEPAPVKEEPKEATPPPAKDEPAPAQESVTEAQRDDSSPPNDEQKPRKKFDALVFQVGPAFMMRNWTIHDPLTNANDGPLLAAHSAPGFGVHAGLRVYPAAFANEDVVRHIGLHVDYARTLASKTGVENVTNDSDDATRNTTIQSLLVGLHVRIPAGPLHLGVLAAYGIDSLTLDGPKDEVAIPDVSATFVRAAVNGDLNIGSATRIGVAVGYRLALGFGEDDGQVQSAEWFPDTSGGAIDGRIELRQMFSDMFGISLGGGLTHYVLDFSVGPDHIENAEEENLPSPPIAGGATDTYTTVDLNAVVVF